MQCQIADTASVTTSSTDQDLPSQSLTLSPFLLEAQEVQSSAKQHSVPFPTESPIWDPLIASTAPPLPHSSESWTPLFKSPKLYNKGVFVPILQMGNPKASRWSTARSSYLNTIPTSRLHKAGQGPDPDPFWGYGRGTGSTLPHSPHHMLQGRGARK